MTNVAFLATGCAVCKNMQVGPTGTSWDARRINPSGLVISRQHLATVPIALIG